MAGVRRFDHVGIELALSSPVEPALAATPAFDDASATNRASERSPLAEADR